MPEQVTVEPHALITKLAEHVARLAVELAGLEVALEAAQADLAMLRATWTPPPQTEPVERPE